MDYNKVILAGRLTRDPELRFLPNGTEVTGFGLATNRSWTDSNTQQKREEVLFMDVEFFGKQAASLSKHFKKGRPIFVEGRLKLDEWETPDGTKRSKVKVIGDQWRFCGDVAGARAQQAVGADEQPAPARATAAGPIEQQLSEDQLPF